MKSLDNIIKFLNEKLEYDWRQLLPFYGVGQICKDYYNDRPTIIDEEDSLKSFGSAFYHGCWIIAGCVGLYKLIKKMF